MRYHYENWSNGLYAGPNFMVNDLYENIAYLNWLPGWIDRYFFNKVSDYLTWDCNFFMSLIFFYSFFQIKKKLL